MRSGLCQLDRQLRMERSQILFRVQASGDARLVGNDKDKKTFVVQ